MEITENTKINGFTVTRIRELPDVHGTLYEMTHDKTHAQLCWLKREDENKTFTITFKTTPTDDTGVFHILEHSVLNGSRKYPVREPFVELLKSSLQTFLNAFTYPDKTMYPVSSRNDTDFHNLVSVYLDAVFHPEFYANDKIFRQEGWHYEIDDPNKDPEVNGIVYNEMKGAFSSSDEIMINDLNRMLFPDNCYQYVSGGDPDHIPELSYEQFCKTHSLYYHPSNARVFLDGNMDIESVLAQINETFSEFDAIDVPVFIPVQKVVDKQERISYYDVDKDDEKTNRTQFAMAKIISTCEQVEKNVAWSAMSSTLVDSNDAPLKKAILDKGLGEDVDIDIYDGIAQPWAFIQVRNTNPEQIPEIRKVIHDTAKSLAENGLDKEPIKAALNAMEFKYRERQEPAGVYYAQRSMDSWLYGCDPAMYFSQSNLFEELRKKTETDYYEQLLAEFLLDEDHLVSSVVIPDSDLAQKRASDLKEKMHAVKEQWGSETEKYVQANKELHIWQSTPNSEEELATLPKLSISDVNPDPVPLEYKEEEYDQVPYIVYAPDDSGIVYLNLYFNLAGITREHLPEVGFYSSLLSNLPTENMTVQKLQEEMHRYAGSLSFTLDSFAPDQRTDACMPMLTVSASVLPANLEKVLDLIKEILLHTKFEKDRIEILLKQDNDDFRQSLNMNGEAVAMRRVNAHLSAEGVFREYVGGYASGIYQKHFEEHYAEEIETFLKECSLYTQYFYTPNRLTVSVVGDEYIPSVQKWISTLPKEEGIRNSLVHYPLLAGDKESIVIPARISFYTAGCKLPNNDAGMSVASHALTYTYLWPQIRVNGGAYGAGASAGTNGLMGMYTYRDPNAKNSAKVMAQSPEFLKAFSSACTQEQLDQLIIGQIGSAEPLLTASAKQRLGDTRYFRGISYEQRQKNRSRILHLTPTDLSKLADDLKQGMEITYTCLVADEKTISENPDVAGTVLEKF